MSEERSAGWFGPLAWAFIAIVACSFANFVVIDDGDACPQGHMPWSCLSWVTIDRYERQFRKEVPVGAPRSQVEDYLRREGIAISEAPAAQASGQSPLTIEKSLPGLWQPLLHITIIFDGNGAVTEIRFRKSMIAP